ncbi:SapC family protein [Rubrivivax rivuli]|uniref:Peptidase n=1 Tax=Rubrivivax rivuli TaxID=1862385 RepID=A0A437RFJ8_9BURK|nr:SapC family protein [Rubrivivax rivuli]RVU45541.1 peptidase [Rubrivivax rivuli]
MINQNLHRQPTALDSVTHRKLKLQMPVTDWRVADQLNAMFVAAAEFGDVCREFPIVFVKAGKEPDGTDAIAPIAVFGLVQNQNLYVTGERWRAQYIPAVLRAYPFCIARIDDDRFAICVDTAWKGASETEGQPLFTEAGEQGDLLKEMTPYLETLEAEIQRTRLVGKKLLELDVLREMRFDATLPDGRQHTVDGFLTVDEKKMTELPDNVVGELHRTGVLGLVHLHWVSMGNMRRLVDWHVERSAAETPAA